MDRRKGFSLVEAMVVVVLMVLIMSAIYLMIMYYRDVSGTEQARVRQTQESRYLLSVFSSEIKNAGAVMTLVNTGGFLTAPPYFNGIYPLNNTNFPDGVILASSDPNAVSKLTATVNPSTGATLLLNNTTATPAWAIGDQGILLGSEGFYVFSVASLTAASITMEAVPVYYSGLLNTAHYDDPETVMGNNVTYPVNAPVMRLADFSIYLVDEHFDASKGRNVRDLVRVSDCNGSADVLAAASPAMKGVIAENVWDLQLVYTAYPNFPDVTVKNNFFTGGGGTRLDLLTALSVKTIKEVTVNVVALTDDFPGRGAIVYPLPLLADRPATSLPRGKFNYKTYSFLIEPRNYNIRL
jgi:prepilin-type N-terminal cleavage/methylation domain-containing protein